LHHAANKQYQRNTKQENTMGFLEGIGKFFGDVGKAIGGAIEGIGKAVSAVAGFVGGVAGFVGDLARGPLGAVLSLIPGVGPIVAAVGSAATAVQGICNTVTDVAGFATRLGKELAQGDSSSGLSQEGLGVAAAAAQEMEKPAHLSAFAEGLSELFNRKHEPEEHAMHKVGSFNYAQLIAHRHAQMIA
jgi:hypothetical protein